MSKRKTTGEGKGDSCLRGKLEEKKGRLQKENKRRKERVTALSKRKTRGEERLTSKGKQEEKGKGYRCLTGKLEEKERLTAFWKGKECNLGSWWTRTDRN